MSENKKNEAQKSDSDTEWSGFLEDSPDYITKKEEEKEKNADEPSRLTTRLTYFLMVVVGLILLGVFVYVVDIIIAFVKNLITG